MSCAALDQECGKSGNERCRPEPTKPASARFGRGERALLGGIALVFEQHLFEVVYDDSVVLEPIGANPAIEIMLFECQPLGVVEFVQQVFIDRLGLFCQLVVHSVCPLVNKTGQPFHSTYCRGKGFKTCLFF